MIEGMGPDDGPVLEGQGLPGLEAGVLELGRELAGLKNGRPPT
jgi:hypothetical protein